jgi:hypothetical protein
MDLLLGASGGTGFSMNRCSIPWLLSKETFRTERLAPRT